MADKPCKVDGCATVGQTRREMCDKHYRRWKANGTTGVSSFEKFGSPAEAFKARTQRRGECLIWTGATSDRGYGHLSVNGKLVPAHRFSYEQANGPILDGAFIDHICHTRACVEPTHLRPASHKENLENLKGPYSNSSTSVRGVGPLGNKWRVRVTHNQTVHYGGVYETIQEAEAAAIKLRNSLFTCNNNDRITQIG